MKIVVCIKQVPSTNEVRLDPVTNTILRDGRQSVVNPFDTYAVEQAVQLKEQYTGSVTAVSMGIPATERLLRDVMARGVDRSLLLSDRAFAGADTLATAYTLALGIKQQGEFDLILCGKMAVDGDTAQIGPELAENLGIPHVTDVCEIQTIEDGYLYCKKITDYGVLRMKVRLPALLTVVKDINMPRLPSIAGVRESLTAPFEMLGAKELGADTRRIGLNGSPTQVVKTYTPQNTRKTTLLTGSSTEQALAACRLVKELIG